MSEVAAKPAVAGLDTAGHDAARFDTRRALQLGLAAIWLLDGVLQYQSFMYTSGFSHVLAATAVGNPSVIARPITWDATLVGHHLALLNTTFATVQLLFGLGIAFRPTLRIALGASIAWSLAVWWLGEGLGGVLSGTADPVSGAPGAVILYALLAVLLWPADRGTDRATGRPGGTAPFIAARAVGARPARALWAVLWLSLAYFALLPANRAPQALNGMLAGLEIAQPAWLAAIERGAAALVAHQGLAASIAIAVACGLAAVGVYLPRRAARAALVLAVVLAAVIWVVGEALGMILASGATDPNSGPLLALLALAYWPASTAYRPAGSPGDGAGNAAGNQAR